MNSFPTRVYFDTGIFATPVLKNRAEPVLNECAAWQRRIETGELEAYTSFLTWDELSCLVRKRVSAASAGAAGGAFLKLPRLQFVDVTRSVMELAQMILNRWHTKPRDAIHAASALLTAGGTIVTLDVDRSDYRRILDEDGGILLNIIEIRDEHTAGAN